MPKLFHFISYLILFSFTALHAAANPDIYFNDAMKAFNRGDYEAAKDLFVIAKQEGLNRAELHFNLGVIYYKLGQFEKSQESFYRTVKDNKTMSLAHYNLGLVAKQLDDEVMARQWFQLAYNDNNKKTRALADIQLKILKIAKHEELNRAELHFILGVTYYKQSQFKKSQDAFYRTVKDKKTMSLAHYNLGLVAKQLDDEEMAMQWFQLAFNDNNKKTRILADRQLTILENKAIDSRWNVVTFSTRYDDNLVDPVLDTGSAVGDVFSELFFASGGPANNGADNGVQLDISAYLNRHRNLDVYDYDLFHLGLTQPFTSDNWLNNAGIQFEYSTFGDQPFQRSGIFEISSKYKSSKVTQYGLRYILRYMESLNTTFDYLQGVQHQLITKVQWSNTGKTNLRYTYEINNLDDLTDGSSFSSFSPQRHSLNLLHKQPVAKKLNWQTRLGYRVSSYPDANVLTDGSSIFRNDSRTQISLSLIKQLNSNWLINVEYQYTNIDSNISNFAYASNLYSVGVMGLF